VINNNNNNSNNQISIAPYASYRGAERAYLCWTDCETTLCDERTYTLLDTPNRRTDTNIA